jgi:hypothetical protein
MHERPILPIPNDLRAPSGSFCSLSSPQSPPSSCSALACSGWGPFLWVQWLVVTTAFLSSLGMALALLLPLWREQWLKFVGYQRENGFALTPSFLALWPAFFATTGFALMLDFLYQRGVASVEPPTAMEAATWPTFPYFVWNFLDAIPYLEIPRTLSWELGFEFTDHVTPVLVLAYKILIIGPVIALAVTVWTDAAQLWKTRRQKRPMASE